jgi:hypothetical protein
MSAADKDLTLDACRQRALAMRHDALAVTVNSEETRLEAERQLERCAAFELGVALALAGIRLPAAQAADHLRSELLEYGKRRRSVGASSSARS